MTGLKSNELLQWCIQENSTYLDCPVKNYANKTLDMIAVVYNPASLATNYTTLKVPSGNFEVKVLRTKTGSFEAG